MWVGLIKMLNLNNFDQNVFNIFFFIYKFFVLFYTITFFSSAETFLFRTTSHA